MIPASSYLSAANGHQFSHEQESEFFYRIKTSNGTMKSTEPRRWTGEEDVKIDPFSRCPNHARVTIEVVDEDTINWRWIGSGGTATATLTHTQP